jgi:hypothetical protein
MYLDKTFTPSKTAQNGLNFITIQEENNLCTKDQPQEIVNIFKLIYIYLNETIPEEVNIFDYLMHTLLKKYKADNLSNFL